MEILRVGPFVLHHVWVGLVEPALTALPGQASWHLVGDVLPLDVRLVGVVHDGLGEHLVLGGRPTGLTAEAFVSQLQVPVVTLDHRFKHELAHQSPLVLTVAFDEAEELLILFLGPHGQFSRVVALGGPLADALGGSFNVAVTTSSIVLLVGS